MTTPFFILKSRTDAENGCLQPGQPRPWAEEEEWNGPASLSREARQREGAALWVSSRRRHLVVSHHVANLWPWKHRVDVGDLLPREAWTINLWPEQWQGMWQLSLIWQLSGLGQTDKDLDCWPFLQRAWMHAEWGGLLTEEQGVTGKWGLASSRKA